jgi:hypothetical protein
MFVNFRQKLDGATGIVRGPARVRQFMNKTCKNLVTVSHYVTLHSVCCEGRQLETFKLKVHAKVVITKSQTYLP